MEFAVPISIFDISKIKWAEPRSGPFRKTIPFTYEDMSLNFNNLIIALEPLKVTELDMERNQLTLEDTRKNSNLNKIEHFQTSVCSDLEKWSKDHLETKGATIVKSPLQPWLKSGKLTLYLSDKPDHLSFYNDTVASIFSDKTVKPGDMIRAIVKIQGVSLQMSEDDIWTGKSRIQHHILQLHKVKSDFLKNEKLDL
jgi:hypothetical protein